MSDTDLPVLQDLADIRSVVNLMNRLKAAEDELVRVQRWGILEDALKLHRLYHQFSMKEEAEGEFDRVLVSLLHNVVKQLPVGQSHHFENGSGI